MTERITDERLAELEAKLNKPYLGCSLADITAERELFEALKTERALVVELTADYLRLRNRVMNAVKNGI